MEDFPAAVFAAVSRTVRLVGGDREVLQPIGLPGIIPAAYADPSFIQIELQQRRDPGIGADIRSRRLELFQTHGPALREGAGKGFRSGRQLAPIIQPVSMSRLHRRLVIVVGKEEVLIIFPDVIDGEATVCFQLCLFRRILLFNPCFDLRPLFIRNMFLIERIEGFPQLFLNRPRPLLSQRILQCFKAIFTDPQGQRALASWLSVCWQTPA